ncbi:MAG: peroxidase, partial [Proteobacteria bacterium]|nr:peroxidase [Pseudomonadota bacterium]
MTTTVDLRDVQGTVTKPYAKFGFPFARYVFYRLESGVAGRAFLAGLLRQGFITTAEPWSEASPPPKATTNVAFTYAGLEAIGVPRLSLQSFPAEFAMGMKARAEILGDDGPSSPDHWDPVWRLPQPVHMWLSISGLADPSLDAARESLEARYAAIQDIARSTDGVALAGEHYGDGGQRVDYQDASITFENGQPSAKEHFGYVDGISDPYFAGCGRPPHEVLGMGKPTGKDPATL